MSIHDAITLLMKSNYKLPSAAPLFLPNAKLFLHVIMKTLKVRLDKKKEGNDCSGMQNDWFSEPILQVWAWADSFITTGDYK